MFYPATEHDAPFVGVPRLMELAFRGADLGPLRDRLVAQLERKDDDADALMDLSCIMAIGGQAELSLRLQAEALSITRRYTLPATGTERLRVLSLMVPGTLMENMPIEFLLHGSDVTLEMVYLDPDPAALALDLPPHDVACMSVCESPGARGLLAALAQRLPELPRPVLNDPVRVLRLARERVWRVLQDVPGCLVPPSAVVSRSDLQRLAQGDLAAEDLLPGAGFPLICRPQGSHAGHGLVRVADRTELAAHLAASVEPRYVISNFVDYRSADGQFRKYRIAFVAGRPYPVHLALSARWMVHYLNGDMLDRPDNRAEEQRFFDGFEQGFGRRHAQTLADIDARLGLDYFSIDCGETSDGRLLVFECDTGGVAHAMDALDKFGYKRRHMLALFAAFRALLLQAAGTPHALKAKAETANETETEIGIATGGLTAGPATGRLQ
jgi:hypothetical protein